MDAERRMIEREVELNGWGYEDIPLPTLREMVDALIEQYGPGATWNASVEWDSLSIKVTHKEPETDAQMQYRIEQDREREEHRAIARAGWEKLTPGERHALRVSPP